MYPPLMSLIALIEDLIIALIEHPKNYPPLIALIALVADLIIVVIALPANVLAIIRINRNYRRPHNRINRTLSKCISH